MKNFANIEQILSVINSSGKLIGVFNYLVNFVFVLDLLTRNDVVE